MGKRRLYYIFLFVLTYSQLSFGADLSCSIQAAVRCICAASLMVDCGSGFSGYIANEEKPNSVVVSVYDKASGKKQDVIMNNPPEGIRSYYAGLDRDPWITRQLGDKGITINSNTQLDVTSAKFPDSLTLYSDADKKGAKSKTQAAAESKYKYSCFYASQPSLVKSQSCNETVCAGTAKCWEKGQYIGQTALACKAKGTACPSASACAADDAVHTDTPKQVDTENFEDSLRHRGVR
jgi:hypothetical protein